MNRSPFRRLHFYLIPLLVVWIPTSVWVSCNGEGEKKKKAKKAKKHLEKGLTAFQSGDFDLALEEYRAACKQHPKSSKAHNYLGMALRYKFYETGDNTYRQEEAEAFEKAVKLQKDWWVPRINLATTLWETGKRQGAAEHYKKGLELRPKHPDAEAIKRRIAGADSLGLEPRKDPR